MVPDVTVAFDSNGLMIPLDQLLPLRKLPAIARNTEKYKCIAASIREVGLIEPLIVFPQPGSSTQYLLLDGTIRLDILKEMGESEVFCLKATEDEAFTYNHKVSRLSAIQEHFMIMRAIENGVSEKRIADTLNVDVAAIRHKRNLLAGICPEAVALLKDKRIPPASLHELKRVVPLRQIEMAELMIAANNYSITYAKCLFAGTQPSQCLAPLQPGREPEVMPEDAARMRRELESLGADFRVLEETHGENVLNLVVSVAYLKCLLGNARITKYMGQHHLALLTGLQNIVDAPDLDAGRTG